MNLQQSKTLFFAQYLGHKIDTSLNGTALDGIWIQRLLDEETDFSLLLRSIYQLANEECITIAKIITTGYCKHFAKDPVGVTFKANGKCVIVINPNGYKFAKVIIEDDGICYKPYNVVNGDMWFTPNQYHATQYLLRIGILLPFTYVNEEQKPVTLKPSEIIELGWAKII